MNKKSVFDRYSLAQLKEFKNKYVRNKLHDNNLGRCAAGAGIYTLFTIEQWNDKSAGALFDDCLALAMRIDLDLYLLED